MKVEVKSNKNLKTILSITIDKEVIKKKLDERLVKLQAEVSLKGFRPGKVPASVIKSQFGKPIYGEVVDKILQESSRKAIEDKKIKIAGQPKMDLITFGEGKDLKFTLEVSALPEIKLKSLDSFKATEFKIKVDQKTIDLKLKEISENHKNFIDKKKEEKASIKDLVVFDYSATVDGNKFEGSEGKGVQLELGKDLFLKGFDAQLLGVKKNDIKNIEVNLPPNHPKKELANKKTKFECKILNVKKTTETIVDDNFAKNMGAKNLSDLKNLVEKQISSQYKQSLDSITKKEILEQIEQSHNVDLPSNLVENELVAITQKLKDEDIVKHKDKNEKLAKSRIKLGLVLNEYGEKNNLKVSEEEVKAEINKQIKGMPGQEKMIIEYYQKNPNAAQGLKSGIYEDKIITLMKSKIKLIEKNLTITEAEKVISNFNKLPSDAHDKKKKKSPAKTKIKKKK